MISFKKKINEIRNLVKSDNKLYLVEYIQHSSGFLFDGKKIYFIRESCVKNTNSIQTSCLTLKNHIFINTVEDTPKFLANYYDIIIFDIEISEQYLDSFVELCRTYVKFSSDVSLSEFFYSILKLFEPAKETSFTNLIGVFGELFFIKKMLLDYDCNLADCWHNSNGSNDKYDFACKNINIEVKTTSKDGMIFTIKHSQIFNDKNNCIVVANICTDNSGESVHNLYNYFKTSKTFSTNLRFIIELETEINRISKSDFYNKKFSVNSLKIFYNKDLDTISDIPDCISSLVYSYDFCNKKSIKLNDLVNML